MRSIESMTEPKHEPLVIGPELSLPLAAVTEKLAWLGRTGSGKTYGAKRLVEQMLRRDIHVIVFDPVGVWWGLRGGRKPLDVPVFGGLHGDVELHDTMGAALADVLAKRKLSAVVDVSQMTDAACVRLATAFGERFFQLQKAAPAAVHLVLEECQTFVPQNPNDGESRMLHEFQRIVKLGRNFGIGVSLISQRPQEINKKALNQSEVVFAFQMTGPQERKALEYWLSDKGFSEKLATLLPQLDVGAPHVWSPSFLKCAKIVHISRIDTDDTSQTPKVGVAASKEKLVPIDVEGLRGMLGVAAAEAKASDPKELRRRISELEKELASAHKSAPERTTKVVERQVVKEATVRRLEVAVDHLHKTGIAAVEACRDVIAALPEKVLQPPPWRAPIEPTSPEGEARRERTRKTFERLASGGAATIHNGLSKLERGLLVAVAQHGELTLRQAAMTAGYRPDSGPVYAAAKALRERGYFFGGNERIKATPTGVDAAGAARLPEGDALAAYWLQRLSRVQRTILQAVLSAYPSELTLAQACEGYRADSGPVYAAAKVLRDLDLIVGSNRALRANERLVS